MLSSTPGTGASDISPAVDERPPNIVYINIDDMGIKDLGCTGSTYYETPRIDRLASEGMLFTDAYAPAANCAPSRACCLTGLYPSRHGIYTVGSSERGNTKTRKLIPTPNTTVLAEEHVTIAEVLKQAGYTSISIGKWHLGPDPRDQGFDHNVGGNRAGHPRSYFSPYKNADLPDGPEGEHLPHRLTNEAISFIDQNRDQPFFLYLPYYSVHTPLQAKSEIIQKYEQKAGSQGQDNATYAAMIESVDHNVGRLLAKLDDLGLTENTLVLFTSDNGGIKRVSSQQPFRAGKGSYYEGGIRVPMLARWPGRIKPGSVCTMPVHGIDLFPTFLAAAGLEPPEGLVLDGLDLVPVLQQEAEPPERPLFWHFPIYLESYSGMDDGRDSVFRTRPGSVVRLGKWKLHEYFEDNALELYDLEADPGERDDLAERNPEKVRELHALLKEWQQSTNAPIPQTLNPEFDAEVDRSRRTHKRKEEK